MWVKIDIQYNKTAFDKELHFINRFGYYFPVYLPLKKILLSMKAIALISRARARDMYDFSYLIPQAKMDFNHVKNDLLKRGINITSPGDIKNQILKHEADIGLEEKEHELSLFLIHRENISRISCFYDYIRSLDFNEITEK